MEENEEDDMTRWMALPAVLAVALVAGCGSSGDDSTSTSTGSDTAASTAASTTSADSSATADKGGKGANVAYMNPVGAQPGQQEIVSGLEMGAKELGWTAESLDSNLSPDKQVANVDTAITQGRNAIASWTLDAGAAAGAYTRAVAQGIPVIGVNSEGEGVTSTVWWEYETCEPGGPMDKTAQFYAKMKPGGKVIVITTQAAPSIVLETKCFTAAAKKEGLDVINTTISPIGDTESGQRLTTDLLTKYRDVDAIWCFNDASALGASAAIIGADKKVATTTKTDGIVVTGGNGDADAITAIKEGRLTGTWDPDNVATGMAAIKQMQTALAGGADKTYPPLTVKSAFYTDENIDTYKPAAERSYTLDTIPLAGG